MVCLVQLFLVATLNSPGAPAKQTVFNVRDFGAKGDGQTLDTVAIQNALDRCGQAGGGIVRLPAGTFLSQPVYLRGNTTLEIADGAILKATDAEADFADPAHPGRWRNFVSFINARNVSNLTITGPGTIDGSGARWWGPAREAKLKNVLSPGYSLPRPRLILITECTNLQVTNLTLINSPSFHLVPTDCENVVIDHVTITAPVDSPNTDAIDPCACRNVVISHCRLDVGDDDIAIKANRARHEPCCEDILVTDCTILHGHGVSIGSETAGGVRGVTVRRCTFLNTESALRIKSLRGKGGVVENILYADLAMSNVQPAILFSCYYPHIPETDTAQPVGDGTPLYRNIRLVNVTATCAKSAGRIIGLPESFVDNVVLDNVHISAPTGLTIENAFGIRLKKVQVTTQRGEPIIVRDAQVDGSKSREEKAK